MVFSSPLFLFAFLPVVLALYFTMPVRAVNTVALVASGLFYAWGEPMFVLVAVGSAALDLVVVRLMAASRRPRVRGLLVGLGVAANLGLLAYFKYANFAYANAELLATGWFGIRLPSLPAIALPIGVSFVVFEKITYIVDVYRGVGQPARSVRDYFLYVFLFPKLLAGPIIKYHDIAAQLVERPRRLDDVAAGLTRFAFGLAKKVLLADPMGELADMAFGGDVSGFRLAWPASSVRATDLLDFRAHGAIGLARMLVRSW
jgi:alginate O-acetyltransferase complex protein AlgI